MYNKLLAFLFSLIVIVIWAGLFHGNAQANRHDSIPIKKDEDYYIEKHCSSTLGGVKEFKLRDEVTGKITGWVDCLTLKYAYEFEWDYKWSQSIGQALSYAKRTGRQPGVVLIITDPAKAIRYIKLLNDAFMFHGIQVDILYVIQEQ